MNVKELREAIAEMPGHWPVTVAVKDEGSDAMDYLCTLDVQRDNFPTQGNIAVIRIDYYIDQSAEQQAWLLERHKFPERGSP